MTILKRQTLLLLASAIVLGGGVLLLESRQRVGSNDPNDATSITGGLNADEDQGKQLLPLKEDEIAQFSIERPVATAGDDLASDATGDATVNESAESLADVTAEDEGSETEDSETVDAETEDSGTEDSGTADSETEDSETEDSETAEIGDSEQDDAVVDRKNAQRLAFQRAEESETWQMTLPEAAAAEDGAVAFLLSQLTGPATHTLTVPAQDLADFGLAEPEITVEVATREDAAYRLTVGGSDFTGTKRYVRAIAIEADAIEADVSGEVDAEPTAGKTAENGMLQIHVVSDNLLTAVNRPVADWLVPPETETEASATEPSTVDPSVPEASEADVSKTDDVDAEPDGDEN